MNITHHEEPWLRESLDRLVDTLDVPGHVTATAMSGGRRLRARRRKVAAIGSVAAVAVLGVGIPTAMNAFPNTPEASFASEGGGPDTSSVDRWDMTARQMEQKLMPLLPANSTTTQVQYRNTDRAPEEKAGPMRGYLAMSVDTGNGYGGLNMIFYKGGLPNPALADPESPWSLRCPANSESCEIQRDATGTPRARLMEKFVDGDGVTVNTVSVFSEDGTMTYLATSNSTSRKWTGPPATDNPPLSLTQMLSIIQSPTWRN